jgi:hypothetical protein
VAPPPKTAPTPLGSLGPRDPVSVIDEVPTSSPTPVAAEPSVSADPVERLAVTAVALAFVLGAAGGVGLYLTREPQ